MPQSSNQSSLKSTASTPLEAISEDDSAPVFALPAPALGFASGKHLHSVKQAHHKPPMPKPPTSSPSPKSTPSPKAKKPLTPDERMAMLAQFMGERDDEGFGLPPPTQSEDIKRKDSVSSEVKKSMFRRMSEKLGHGSLKD